MSRVHPYVYCFYYSHIILTLFDYKRPVSISKIIVSSVGLFILQSIWKRNLLQESGGIDRTNEYGEHDESLQGFQFLGQPKGKPYIL